MADNHPQIQHHTHVVSEHETQLQEPDFYHVVLNNDDYTPMDFVIDVLMRLFDKSYDEAYIITLDVHHNERGVAGVYPKEVANEKAEKVNALAASNEFPLNCSIEKA